MFKSTTGGVQHLMRKAGQHKPTINNTRKCKMICNSSSWRCFSVSCLNRNVKDEKEEPSSSSYSEQITKLVMEKYQEMIKSGDPSAFDRIRDELDKEENEQSIQTIIRNVRMGLVSEPTEEIKQKQEDRMDERHRKQFELRKQQEIERRKNAGKEQNEPKRGGIEYRVVERS